jgi:hydroxyacyl-ACP dehydratase HTD2-like protein with hotdog domain
MWAGGNVRWKSPLKVDGSRYACVEGIRDVTIKGKPGQEKVFVGIERRIGAVDSNFEEADIRRKLWADKEDDFAEADVVERRNIVFMYEKTEEELDKVRKRGAAVPKEKMLKRTCALFYDVRQETNSVHRSAKRAHFYAYPYSNANNAIPILGAYI